jgi:hypothetical protein
MGLINIANIEPGMKLASPVFSSQGVLLLGEGTSITAKHILLFKTWGVLEADIEGKEMENDDNVDIEGSDNEELICRQKALEHRFSAVLDNEVMAEVFRIAKKQLVEGFLSS